MWQTILLILERQHATNIPDDPNFDSLAFHCEIVDVYLKSMHHPEPNLDDQEGEFYQPNAESMTR